MFFKKYQGWLWVMLVVSQLIIIGCFTPLSPNQGEEAKEFQAPSAGDNRLRRTDMMSDVRGESCKPSMEALSRDGCLPGYICVASAHNENIGTCLQDCGKKEGDRLVKRPEACTPNDRCMLLRKGDLTAIGMFCLKPQKYRDLPCESPFDAEACADGLSCLPTARAIDQTGITIFSNHRCKQECSADRLCQNAKEQCLKPSYARKDRQYDALGKAVGHCKPSQCNSHGPACPCDGARGFICENLIPGVDAGVCMRFLGVCGEPIALASIKDFKGHNYLGETCNESFDHRICQNLVGARSICQPLSESGEGICLARCSLPALDQDGDSHLSEEESGASLACPDGYTCGADIAKRLNMYSFIEKEGLKKSCNPIKCQKNLPCPTECGPGDAQCLAIGHGEQLQHVCGAPHGTCIAN